MSATPEQQKELRESEHYRSLMVHEGWKLVREGARSDLLRLWQLLRDCKPEDLKYLQGRIDGINHVLDFCDAKVQSADEVLRQIRADEAEATRDALARAEAQRQRMQRSVGVGTSFKRGAGF